MHVCEIEYTYVVWCGAILLSLHLTLLPIKKQSSYYATVIFYASFNHLNIKF